MTLSRRWIEGMDRGPMENRLKDMGIQLTQWYVENKRDLPWRHTKDAYKIWISEIMLQQTRVDTVIDYYLRFLERFPDVCTLAAADEQEVLTAWKGLGYYSRARNIHRAARMISEKYSGVFPGEYEKVRALPGIGGYTAGAVLSIAFDQPHAAVDGNVLRVISRIESIGEDITLESTKKQIASLVSMMIPGRQAGDFTQALMELGALLCTPVKPQCEICPVKNMCVSRLSGTQNQLPVKKKDNKAKQLYYWAAVIQKDRRILLEHRREDTLLGHMWGLPVVEKSGQVPEEELFQCKYGLKLKKNGFLGKVKHIFSHQVWHMDAVSFTICEESLLPSSLQWVAEEAVEHLAVPTAFQKVFRMKGLSSPDNSIAAESGGEYEV